MSMSGHGLIPAGVYGAGMVGAGDFMLNYTPMFMHMEDAYIGTTVVSPQTIVTTVPSKMKTTIGGRSTTEMYRIAPQTMDVQAQMLHGMVGVTNWLNLMVMVSYLNKSMTMTTFAGASGTTVLGNTGNSTSGFGDTNVMALVRLYQDGINHVHLNLGLSLPTGSTTETLTMLSPMNRYMTMRANYSMQLGTGTVDLLPGLTYTGHVGPWSWGAIWRSRVALDSNSEGYNWGTLEELSAWGGYTWIPGITTTARVLGGWRDYIHGADPKIFGLMPGSNPRFYGGKWIDLLGGIEIAGHYLGLGHTALAVEAGGPVCQNLNGPQLGQAWQVNVALGVKF